MDFKALSVAFVQWQAIPEILSKPEALRLGFKFLGDPSPSYPPSDLPVLKPLGRVVPISSQALEFVPQTSKFWSILEPHSPVQIVPSLGLQSTLAEVTLSAIELRIFIHSFGVVTSFSANVESASPIPGHSLGELLSKLEQGQSLRSQCHAMKSCNNVRTLFKRVLELLIPEILTVKPAPLHRDVRTFRPFCVLVPHTGNFPNSAAELESLPDERLQLHAALERAPGPQGEVDARNRYGIDIGRRWRTGAETGWVFSSMNGFATYIRNPNGTGADKQFVRTRGCHFHNLRAVIGMYRLAYSFLAAGLLNSNGVAQQYLRYAEDVIRSFRIEYPGWGIRWGIRKLKVHEKVNNKVDESRLSIGSGYEIFVCYAHEDEQWLGRFRTMLGPEIAKRSIALKDDREIGPGTQWNERIAGWLRSVKAAVLFVSPAFTDSKYIRDIELPALLAAREERGLKIYWVLVSDAMWQSTPLWQIQSADLPPKAWAGLSPPEQETKLRQLAETILQDLAT